MAAWSPTWITDQRAGLRTARVWSSRRERIMILVQLAPGVNVAGLAAAEHIAESTVDYHVRILIKAGLVERRHDRRRRRDTGLYPVGTSL